MPPSVASARSSRVTSATHSVEALRIKIRSRDSDQRQRQAEIAMIKNDIFQFVNVFFVAVAVIYATAAFQASAGLACKSAWGPTILLVIVNMCACRALWMKLSYLDERTRRFMWRDQELWQLRRRLKELRSGVHPLSPLLSDPGLPPRRAPLAVQACGGVSLVCALMVLSFADLLCFK